MWTQANETFRTDAEKISPRTLGGAQALNENEVRVHLYDLTVNELRFRELQSFLSDEECRKYDRTLSVVERRRQIVARGLLREALAEIIGAHPSDLRIQATEIGKPYLVLDSAASIQFNLSHTGDLLAIAFSQHREVGIDVEKARDAEDLDCDRAAQLAFGEGELAEFMSLPMDLRRQGFFDGWVRKEAFSKAVGMGMTLPFDQFRITVDPRLPAEISPPESERRRWILRDLDIGPNHHGAIAIGRGRRGEGEPEVRVLRRA